MGIARTGALRQAIAPALLIGLLAGCTNDFKTSSTAALGRSVMESARREASAAELDPDPILTERTAPEISFPPERMEELEKMAGPRAYESVLPEMGEDLMGENNPAIGISLEQAVGRAVQNNLDLQIAYLAPSITEAQIVAAEAAFDWVLSAGFEANWVDQPNVVPVVQGIPVGSAVNERQIYQFNTGVSSRLVSGGQVSIDTGLEINNNEGGGTDFFPDPARRTNLTFGLNQPLLRGFGSDVNLAEVRLAQNAERAAIQDLKSQLIAIVTETERAYWDLRQARMTLLIATRLLERGIETRDVLQGRLDFDVKPAEYSDAVARVESRRADVIRAQNSLRQSSDRLKQLMNDPDLPVGDETVLRSIDRPIDAPIEFSLLDSLTTSFAHRPEIQTAILNIDDASIRQLVAENGELPLLDLRLQANYNGLDDDAGRAYQDIGDADYVDYLIGLDFEQAIGNRAATALSRQRRLERIQSVIVYRATVQQVVLDVKTALRNVATNYRLILQTRTARLAAAENLRTLEVEEENTRALTPDFLDLKLRRQEALSQAELEEVAALADYATALADYYAAMGTALDRNNIEFVVPDVGDFEGVSANDAITPELRSMAPGAASGAR